MTNLTGAILSGGHNRRMNGAIKALLPFGEGTILNRIAAEMGRVCTDRFVVAANEEQVLELEISGERIVRDLSPGKGPLAGLQAAFTYSKTEWVWISAGDMPFASASAASFMLRRLINSSVQAVIPDIGGRLHPLQAVYQVSCLRKVAYNLSEGRYRMMDWLQEIHTATVTEAEWLDAGINLRFVENLNTPEEYRDALNDGRL